MRLISLIISGFEPRASSSGNGTPGTAMTGSRLVHSVGRVYPGYSREGHIGRCIPTIVPGEAYIERCIPTIVHPEVYHPTIPG